MKKGRMDLAQIEKDYTMMDSLVDKGEYWRLYEHDLYGDDVSAIAVNLSKMTYTYTQESLAYTVENLDDEYELLKL